MDNLPEEVRALEEKRSLFAALADLQAEVGKVSDKVQANQEAARLQHEIWAKFAPSAAKPYIANGNRRRLKVESMDPRCCRCSGRRVAASVSATGPSRATRRRTTSRPTLFVRSALYRPAVYSATRRCRTLPRKGRPAAEGASTARSQGQEALAQVPRCCPG